MCYTTACMGYTTMQGSTYSHGDQPTTLDYQNII